MTISFVAGDLFVNSRSADFFAHGCNCVGAMGAGIALQFKKEYPKMYETYRQMCKNQQFKPGDVFPWFEFGKPSVLNLATQLNLGSDAKLEYLETAFQNVVSRAEELKIKRLALPRIGAGIGGLKWADVKELMKSTFEPVFFDVFVYEDYIKEQS